MQRIIPACKASDAARKQGRIGHALGDPGRALEHAPKRGGESVALSALTSRHCASRA